MLKVNNLTVCFDNFTAVKDVSFDVKKGEIFGLLGANGAGKTTTIRVLCGLLPPTEGGFQIGEAIFDNKNLATDTIKSKIGYMSQKFTLYDDLTISENWEFVAAIRGMSKQEFTNRSKNFQQWPVLNNNLDQLVSTLPSGIKQQVALTSAMFHNPDIIFLDEPTAGVSPFARKQFWDLIKNLANGGTTVIVTTHYMDEAENCHRLALMRSGEIIALDTPFALKQKTFPHGIWSLNEKYLTPEIKSSLASYQRQKAINNWICGTKIHLATKNLDSWNKLQTEHPSLSLATKISPSLEDVFLELVEGVTR